MSIISQEYCEAKIKVMILHERHGQCLENNIFSKNRSYSHRSLSLSKHPVMDDNNTSSLFKINFTLKITSWGNFLYVMITKFLLISTKFQEHRSQCCDYTMKIWAQLLDNKYFNEKLKTNKNLGCFRKSVLQLV